MVFISFLLTCQALCCLCVHVYLYTIKVSDGGFDSRLTHQSLYTRRISPFGAARKLAALPFALRGDTSPWCRAGNGISVPAKIVHNSGNPAERSLIWLRLR